MIKERRCGHPPVYRPERIVKVAGSIAKDQEDNRWAYLVDFLKNDKKDMDEPWEQAAADELFPWQVRTI